MQIMLKKSSGLARERLKGAKNQTTSSVSRGGLDTKNVKDLDSSDTERKEGATEEGIEREDASLTQELMNGVPWTKKCVAVV